MNVHTMNSETMHTNVDETVLDFDLNFLQQSPVKVNDFKIEKLQKSIAVVKKKTIATDLLIRKYYAQQEQLEQSEKIVLTAREDYKQKCIDYKKALERCSILEKEAEIFKTKNVDLASKLTVEKNQCDALKSHTHQLQMLVKDNEAKIEALTVEKRVINENVDMIKNETLQKENEMCLSHIRLLRDIVLGKTKLDKRHKLILQKYETKKNKKSVDDKHEMVADCSNDDVGSLITPSDLLISSPDNKNVQDDILLRNMLQGQQILETKSYRNIKGSKENVDFDDESDCSTNEFISEDTGCGSSITFSDGDKCFNSPDYFINDSPLQPDNVKNKNITTLVDTATSPFRTCERNEIATSPLIFDDEALLNGTVENPDNNTDINGAEYFITDIPFSTDIVTIKEKRKLLDIGTSPIRDVERVNTATSPVIFIENILSNDDIELNSNSTSEKEPSDCNEINETFDTNIQNLIGKLPTLSNLSSSHELEICEKSGLEKKCLESHNSKNLLNECNSDEEIQMILNTMRLNHKILTPIPETPSKTTRIKKRGYNVSKKFKDQIEIKKLHRKLDILTKLSYRLNYLFENKTSAGPLPSIEVNSELNNQVNNEMCENTSQEVIILDNNVKDKPRMCKNVVENLNTINTSELENTKSYEAVKRDVQLVIVQNDCNLDLTGYKDDSDISRFDNNVKEATSSTEYVAAMPEVNSDEGSRVEIENEHTKYSQNSVCRKNVIKRNKKSKLDKLKNKCMPKYKISKASLSSNKNRRLKPKPLSTLRCTNKTDALVLLNNKSAYEKAVKVMSEMKSKEKKEGFFKSKSSLISVKQHSQSLSPQKDKTNMSINLDSTIFTGGNVENLSLAIPFDGVVNSKNLIEEDIGKRNNKSIIKHDGLLSPVNDPISVSRSNSVTTRSRSKRLESNETENMHIEHKTSESNDNNKLVEKLKNCRAILPKLQESRRQLKRGASISPEIVCKRVLRSSSVKQVCTYDSNIQQLQKVDSIKTNDNSPKSIHNSPKLLPELKVVINVNDMNHQQLLHTRNVVKYIDFDEDISNSTESNLVQLEPKVLENLSEKNHRMHHNRHLLKQNYDKVMNEPEASNAYNNVYRNLNSYPKNSILCHMIEKHGKKTIRFTSTKVSDKTSSALCRKLEDDIAHIIQLQTDKYKPALNKLVEDIQRLDLKIFITGFMMYLKDPGRKRELFNKVNSPPAPAMTKSEQVILYIVKHLNRSMDLVNIILTNIEFSLFQLNKTPDCGVVESISHLYALICRYFGLKHRLRLFILDAMYCLQYKVIPIIKQCLDVWMHILPLAHIGIAKTPLVTCLVYLLHFYKCDYRSDRVREIRSILSQKYFYQITDWNEMKILEMFKNAIKEVKDVTVENKILRTALIILAKRLGAKWCQKNIIRNMLLPMMEEKVSEKCKRFCITMLGPLMKPFPADMKVHCEIMVNQLLDMLQQNPSDSMKEAIFTSLIYMNKHNQFRVTQALLLWEPQKISKDFEELLCDFVREKPIKTWLKMLPKMMEMLPMG